MFEVSQTRAPGAAGLISTGSLSLAEKKGKSYLDKFSVRGIWGFSCGDTQGKKLTQNLKKKSENQNQNNNNKNYSLVFNGKHLFRV